MKWNTVLGTAIAACASMLVTGQMAVAGALPAPVADADYYDNGKPRDQVVALGQMLFFDKIMSGNKNISCATCHNPLLTSADGLSLPVGEGGHFIGPYRTTGEGDEAIEGRVGRHTPHLFNLGAKEFVKLNWNGIHAADPTAPGGLIEPSGRDTPRGLTNVLAGQSLFPIVNFKEMIGGPGENEIANLVQPGDGRFPPLWDAYVARLTAIPEYVDMFKAAYVDVQSGGPIGIQHYANAVSAFQATAFRADQSRFDQSLRGDASALNKTETAGRSLFYGKAGCDGCHSGKFQTDHSFHGIAMPQIGPGPEAAIPLEDRGRAETTLASGDFAKFRTPSLRNVAHTAPYGHDGAYATLEGVIRHHLNPVDSLNNYDTSQAVLTSRDDLDASDFDGHNDTTLRQKIINANELQPTTLSNSEVKQLIAFLNTLTDPASLDKRSLVPARVPSGLPVGD